MAEVVYLLCALTSSVCAILLTRGYRTQRSRILLWSSLCFLGLACNSVLLFVDVVLVPSVDLSLVRIAVALGAVLMLLFGLIVESK